MDAFVSLGVSVIVSDVDVAWMRDPLEYMNRVRRFEMGQGVGLSLNGERGVLRRPADSPICTQGQLPCPPPQYPEAEVLVSSDGRGTEDPTEDLQSKSSFYDVANIGIIFFRPGAAAKEFAEVRRGARGARVGGGILKGMIAW